MTNDHDSLGRNDTFMNNYNDTQHSNMQEHIVNRIPTGCEQEESEKQIPTHKNIGKLDDKSNTQTRKNK